MDYSLVGGSRLAQARFYQRYHLIANIISLGGLIGLGGLGVFFLVSGVAFGWLVLSFGLWFLMPIIWLNKHLKNLPPNSNPKNMTDILSVEVLGLLTQNITPRSIINSLSNTPGGRFLAMRLGLSWEQVATITPDDEALLSQVWQESINVWNSLPERDVTVSSIVVLAAVVRLNGALSDIMNNLRIDNNDVFNVVVWYEHIGNVVRIQHQPRLTGGIGRDWSFGYIPTLEHFGVNLSSRYSSGARSVNTKLTNMTEMVNDIINFLSSTTRHNVALIGEAGVGKSTVVDSLAEILMDASAKTPQSLKFNQVFMLDASAILSASKQRGDVEQLVNKLMVEALNAKNIILFLDNAELFFADETGAIDLSNLLQPVIEGGALKLIMAMNRQKYLQIATSKPALAGAINRIEMTSADRNDTIRIMADKAISIEHKGKCFYTYQALTEAYRLSERYINDISQPRAAVQLLENSAHAAESGRVTPRSVSATIEKTTGIKVGGDLTYGDNEAERQKLLNLEQLIHERMINQTGAVSAVASALRRARAGVRNENRPIGTFLFLGPTGVGKTELAKALAGVYFGGEEHMVRLDLNEYVRSEDVSRLIADGATDPMSLSAQVQKNPFSVVLLDEIEKAHPNVLTTLLQVLDEGILRDIHNRSISFRDTILIATSNAGADRIRQYIEKGYQLEQFSQQIEDELINSNQFKPEFLNRFDEIAVFRPLSKEELGQVIDLILVSINKTLANQKVAVAVDDEGKSLLVEAGYDPRLGARPMRRVVQRSVENIVAEKMLSGELVAGSGIRITGDDVRASLEK